MTSVIIEQFSYDGYSENIAINISDEQLLKLGKKYFELASNPQNSPVITNGKDPTTSSLYESGILDEIVCSTCKFRNAEASIEPCKSCNNWSNWEEQTIKEDAMLQAAKDIQHYCQTHACESPNGNCPLLLKTDTTTSCRAGMALFYPRDWNLSPAKENDNG